MRAGLVGAPGVCLAPVQMMDEAGTEPFFPSCVNSPCAPHPRGWVLLLLGGGEAAPEFAASWPALSSPTPRPQESEARLLAVT